MVGSGVTEVCEAAVPAGSSALVQCRAAFLSSVCRRRQPIRRRNHRRRNKVSQWAHGQACCPHKQVEKAGAPNQRTGLQNGRRGYVPAQVFRYAGKTRHSGSWLLLFVPNLRMPHLGYSRPVWCHLCSPAACSWPSGSPPHNSRF